MPIATISLLRRNIARFKRLLILGNVLCFAIFLAAAVVVAMASYEGHQDRAREAAKSLAQSISQDVSETLSQIDHTLLSTVRQVDRLETYGSYGPLTARELLDLTEEQRALVPAMTALRFTDAKGMVLNPEDQQSISVADRDYFSAAKANLDGVAVSDPLKGRLKNGWGLVLARARISPDGRFLGVVYGGITTSTFHQQFTSASIGARGAVSMRNSALKLIVRYSPLESDVDAGVGTSNVSDALRAAFSADYTQGVFRTRTALDGIERVTAYRQVPGFPLTLAVGLATEDFLEPWWRQLWQFGSMAILFEAIVVGFSVIIYRSQQRQQRSGETIARLASERGKLLDNDLVGMVKLRDRREVWHNKALAKLFGYGTGELTGVSLRVLYTDDESYAGVGEAYTRIATGNTFRTQLQMVRKDGTKIWVDLSGSALDAGESLWLVVDITAVKNSEESAQHLAFHDALTGLPNRHLLAERLGFLLLDAERRQSRLAVCYLDLDGFKAINDQHGHDAGDELLRIAAERLNSTLRANDVVARMGGDEFVVVLNQMDPDDAVELALGRLLAAFASPILLWNGTEARVGVSVGVALYPSHARSGPELITLADQAMLAGKRSGKGRWVLHGADARARSESER